MHGDAADLAKSRLRGPFDGILAAYLVRNLADPDAALRQFHDLLRPGAPLAVHEYSVRDSARSRAVWTAVCWSVIIPMGLVRTGSSDLYRYLWRSVLRFDGVQTLTERMRRAGFDDVRVQTVPGWQQHIVHTFLGRRPPEPAAAGPTRPTRTLRRHRWAWTDTPRKRPADRRTSDTQPLGSPRSRCKGCVVPRCAAS